MTIMGAGESEKIILPFLWIAEIEGAIGVGHHRDYSNEKDFHPLVCKRSF